MPCQLNSPEPIHAWPPWGQNPASHGVGPRDVWLPGGPAAHGIVSPSFVGSAGMPGASCDGRESERDSDRYTTSKRPRLEVLQPAALSLAQFLSL